MCFLGSFLEKTWQVKLFVVQFVTIFMTIPRVETNFYGSFFERPLLWFVKPMTNKILRTHESDAQIFARFLVNLIDFELKWHEEHLLQWQWPIEI